MTSFESRQERKELKAESNNGLKTEERAKDESLAHSLRSFEAQSAQGIYRTRR
jgi:hypothetical protein